MPRGAAEEAQATHVVAQHRGQRICRELGGRTAVSFVWVYSSVKAGRLLYVTDDKARPSCPPPSSHVVWVYCSVKAGRLLDVTGNKARPHVLRPPCHCVCVCHEACTGLDVSEGAITQVEQCAHFRVEECVVSGAISVAVVSASWR